MNIFDFEDAVMPIILKRGQDYFRKEKVDQLMQVGVGEYVLEIEGTHLYEVFVEIDNDYNIIMSDCTCPYDMGPHCKHEVAAYLAIRKQLEEEQLPTTTLDEHLKEMSKAELIELIKELVADDQRLKIKLTKRLSDIEDDFWIEEDEHLTFEAFNDTVEVGEMEESTIPDVMTDQQLLDELKKYPVSFARVFFPSSMPVEEQHSKGRNKELEKIGLKFQIINGYTNYIPNLASYYNEEEWTGVLRDIAKQMKELKGSDFWAYEELISVEGLEDELLAYCQHDNEAIVRHYDVLNELYPEAVEEIFRKLILEKAAVAKNRSQYMHVCELIHAMELACDSEAPYDLVNELIELYPRKRVFVDLLEEV